MYRNALSRGGAAGAGRWAAASARGRRCQSRGRVREKALVTSVGTAAPGGGAARKGTSESTVERSLERALRAERAGLAGRRAGSARGLRPHRPPRAPLATSSPLQPQAPPDNHGPRRTPWVPPPAAGHAGRRGSHWLFGLEPRPTQLRNKGRFCKQRTTSGTNVYGPGEDTPSLSPATRTRAAHGNVTKIATLQEYSVVFRLTVIE